MKLTSIIKNKLEILKILKSHDSLTCPQIEENLRNQKIKISRAGHRKRINKMVTDGEIEKVFTLKKKNIEYRLSEMGDKIISRYLNIEITSRDPTKKLYIVTHPNPINLKIGKYILYAYEDLELAQKIAKQYGVNIIDAHFILRETN